MKKPNVLFIMADSLPPNFLGAYGDRTGATPNLDALAARGAVFENAYCNSPLCAPSRASLMTGRYVSEIGCLDNANPLSSEIPTAAHAFRRAGYETALAGKMHFVGHDQLHGFDAHLANEADYSKCYNPHEYRMAYDWETSPASNPVGTDWMSPSYVYDEKWDSYTFHYDNDNIIHGQAMRYLSQKTQDSEPFFACVSYHHPHNPFYIPEEYKARFKDMDLTLPSVPDDIRERYGVMDKWLNEFHHQPERLEKIMCKDNLRWLYETFYGMVNDVDSHVGELLDRLGSKGLLENTVVVFTSDHGDMLGHRGMVQKRCLYDWSVKVPLIISMPGESGTVRRVASPVSLIDLLPTFAGIAQVAPPEGLPGVSLLPAVSDGGERLPENRVVFSEYHGEGVHAPCFMAVKDGYKFIYVHGHEEYLYDLTDDPEELNNIGENPEYAAVKEELRRKIFSQFDPDAVAKNARRSQRDRGYIFNSHFNNQIR